MWNGLHWSLQRYHVYIDIYGQEVDMDEDDDLEDETEEERGGAPMPSCRFQQC